MNIRDIVETTDCYNLHSHTPFCDGHFPMSEMAAAACMCGMRHYAFTPHSPVPVASPCNMSSRDVSPFLQECRQLRLSMADSIALYTGMEIDWIDSDWGPHIAYFTDLELDVRIGSVHFVKDQGGEAVDCDGNAMTFVRNLHERFRGDLRYVVEKYFQQVLEMISHGGFDILGHLDKIAANASAVDPGVEDCGWYVDSVKTVIDEAVTRRLIVEINTKAYRDKGRFFPDVRWWSELLERGVVFSINSDAHYVEKVNHGRMSALKILQKMREK